MPPAVVHTDSTPAPVRTCPPASCRSAAMAAATAPKSTIPVLGECSAAWPTQWGSTSAIWSAASRRSPGTPLVVARRSSSSRAATSEASLATISLPQRW